MVMALRRRGLSSVMAMMQAKSLHGPSDSGATSRSRQQQRVFPLGELVTAPNGDWNFLIL
jgi:hypothetical protein